jgi:asparagine synthetase B (glutamine-hydrolysing)
MLSTVMTSAWSGRTALQASVERNGGRVVVLASGGLDSRVLLSCVAELAGEVHPLFVRNGHPWEDAEVAALRRFVAALDRPQIRPVAERALPLRDLLEVHWDASGYQPGFSEGYRANFIPAATWHCSRWQRCSPSSREPMR